MCHWKWVVCTREGGCLVMYQCHFPENVLCNMGEVLALKCDCLFWEKSHPTSLMKDQGLHPNLWAIKCRLASTFLRRRWNQRPILTGFRGRPETTSTFLSVTLLLSQWWWSHPASLVKNEDKRENNVIKVGKLTKMRMTWTKVVIFVFATFWPPNRLMAHMQWETNKLWANSNKQLLIGRIDIRRLRFLGYQDF